MVETVDSYDELTVEELKEELSSRDLAVSGSKAELVARLEEDDGDAGPGGEGGEKGVGRGTGQYAAAGFEASQEARLASQNQEIAELKAEAKQNTADVHDILPRLTAIEERLSNAGL